MHGPNTGVGVHENMFLQMAFMCHLCLSREVSVFQKWQNPWSLSKFLSRTVATEATEEIKKLERLLHQRGSKVAHRILVLQELLLLLQPIAAEIPAHGGVVYLFL